MSGAHGGRTLFKPSPKASLHLLFVISRPAGTGFLDPRADSQPVLDAIDQHAPGRVTCEFLRPPTLDALTQRLEDKAKMPVDILHLDGPRRLPGGPLRSSVAVGFGPPASAE